MEIPYGCTLLVIHVTALLAHHCDTRGKVRNEENITGLSLSFHSKIPHAFVCFFSHMQAQRQKLVALQQAEVDHTFLNEGKNLYIMKLIFELILIWGVMKTSRFHCVLEKEYFCSSIPNDFPESLTSILLVVTKIGVINSTVFNSPNLKSVTSLAIANSGITRIEPGAFYAFRSLTKLNLYQNNLTTVMASWLSKPWCIENLTVSQNIIEEIGPQMLSSFSNLTTLNLASNRIHMIADGSLTNLSKLTFINLSGNNLSTLTRNAFSGLISPVMKLGGNPWNCSCELQDFGFFLQELMNASVLEDALSVVCQSPPGLKGIPVWNISDFNCPPILSSPPLENDFYKVGLPMILLCSVLFLFLLLLLLFWKVKQDKKQVLPGEEATVENRHEKLTDNINRMTKRLRSRGLSDEKVQNTVKIVKTQQNRMQKSRAKSASPIMLRTEFQYSSSQHRRPTDGNQEQSKITCTAINKQIHMKNEDCSNIMQLWYLNDFQDCNKTMQSHKANTSSTELSVETPKEDNSELLKQSSQDHGISEMCWNDETKGSGNTENFEPLLYLSIASTTNESHSEEKGAVSKYVTMRQCSLRRVLTWPYEKCKRNQDKNILNYEDFFKAHYSMSTNDAGVPAAIVKIEFKDEQNQYGLHLHTVKEQKATQDYSTGKPELKKEAKPVKKLASPLKKGSKQIAAMENACISMPGKGFKGSESIKEKRNNKDIPSQAGFCNNDLHSPASSDESGHTCSPCDDTLLENNEYTFIDLLHEVVENRGRWTRERWKQTHRVQIASHPQMKAK